MSTKKRLSILHNLASMTTAEVLTRLANYFYTLYLSFQLGVSGLGLIATALSFSDIYVIMISHGFDVYAISEISRRKDKVADIASSVLFAKSTLGLLSYGMLVGIVTFLDRPALETSAIFIAGLHIFGKGVNGRWIYQGLERMNVIAIRQVISALLLILFVYLAVNSPDDILLALWVQVGVEIINTIWTLVYFLREGHRFVLPENFSKIISVVKSALPYGAFFLLVSLYNTIDKNMIWLLRENFEYENGILHSSIKIMSLFIAPSAIIQGVYYPRFSVAQTRVDKEIVYKDYLRLMSVSLSIGFGIMAFHPSISTYIYPQQFAEVSLVLPYHGTIVSLIYFVLLFTVPLMAWGKQKQLIVATSLGVLANIILNFILIPKLGIYGALTSTIMSELIVMLYSYNLFRKEQIPLELRYPILALISSLIIFGGWTLFGLSGLNLIFVITMLSIVHLLLLWAVGVMDIATLKKLARK